MNTERAEKAISLAKKWIQDAYALESKKEQDFRNTIKTMLEHEKDKYLLINLMDQSFRATDKGRAAAQIKHILDTYGLAHFFSDKEKLLVRLFLLFGKHFPSISVPQIVKKIRESTREVIIPGEPEALTGYLQKRSADGVRTNVNFIGEALLGERAAEERLAMYIEALQNPNIDYLSVKISTLYSQISVLAYKNTLSVLQERLTTLYRAALAEGTYNDVGEKVGKFVNLDMEEYRDLELTVEAFMQTLDQREFQNLHAGIVLQAYLPDSFGWLVQLTDWAQARIEKGGAPIKVRLVKGANMEMELIESELKGWPLAPYNSKVDTDANFKRMLEFALEKENAKAVHIGIGSHNLFDMAYAKTLSEEFGSGSYLTFEMLEGMAPGTERAIRAQDKVVMYAPVADQVNFINAMAYLVRRLDENTAEENFLRHSFDLTPGSSSLAYLEESFLASIARMDDVAGLPFREQNRQMEVIQFKNSTYYNSKFINEPDTDFTIPNNRIWADQIRTDWKKSEFDDPMEIPLVIAGNEIKKDKEILTVMDKSQVHQKIVVGKVSLASIEEIKVAFASAKADPAGWGALTFDDRHKILSNVGRELRKQRGNLMGVAMAETGKILTEADAEVSEAIDFAEFYPFAVKQFDTRKNLELNGLGAGLVISPWNFPIAIPAGGILASLAAGNCTILKPSSDAAITAYHLCKCFWKAGVPKEALQFLPTKGRDLGATLESTDKIDFVILTGGTDTAVQLIKNKPDLPLTAETGGKNATFVSAISDRDQAIKHIVHSAFSNAGQKCSATSLLLLEEEVYEDPVFKATLKDAVESLSVGSAWDYKTKLGPLATIPSGDLAKGLEELEPGEEWLVTPKKTKQNPYLISPGIKWGVQQGNHCFEHELFGPVLSVVKVKDIREAVEFANSTGYGLTSGIETLDEREKAYWRENIQAGNIYINRPTTGAIVMRQPFGGMGKSAYGPGIKAGSINYPTQFFRATEIDDPKVLSGSYKDKPFMAMIDSLYGLRSITAYGEIMERVETAAWSYKHEFNTEFSQEHDYFSLRGEDNILRYLPLKKVLLRFNDPENALLHALVRMVACKICGVDFQISTGSDISSEDEHTIREAAGKLGLKTPVNHESTIPIQDKFKTVDRIIADTVTGIDMNILRTARLNHTHVVQQPPVQDGRLELIHYFQEQTISHSYHRHGNLGDRHLKEEEIPTESDWAAKLKK